MKKAQIIGFSVAAVAGGLAFVLSKSMTAPAPQAPQVQVQQVDMVQVLVARSDIGIGQVANESSFRWQEWPRQALSPSFVTRQARPRGPADFSGAIARVGITANEPISATKLIKPGSGGVLAAILTPGMRALSIKISEHTSVGRLILPNDHVDVLLTSRVRPKSGGPDEITSEAVLRNVRVLAIGQLLEAKEGRKNADGNVASLELSPSQAETLSQAAMRGELALILRSVADIAANKEIEDKKQERGAGIKVLRYGVRTKAYASQ